VTKESDPWLSSKVVNTRCHAASATLVNLLKVLEYLSAGTAKRRSGAPGERRNFTAQGPPHQSVVHSPDGGE
jgi:hypothetical protein